ncbi:hypothetical protein OCU04_003412 [Sclerotinia nivalis]|uniref:Uncharacterized protein n=1 Tax=Sclerotinia nivalis TaxID=352851 RepID=A0A9X0DLB2_9HELO|nr:hypothetical protein OCU04_003412 [Sclerotinia nivalis]
MAFDIGTNPAFSGSLLPNFEDEEPVATDATSSAPNTQTVKSNYAIVRKGMEDLIKLHGLSPRDEKDYELVEKNIDDMQKHERRGTIVDEKSELVDSSPPSDEENETQKRDNQQPLNLTPNSLRPLPPIHPISPPLNSRRRDAATLFSSDTTYRWHRNNQGELVNSLRDGAPVVAVDTNKDAGGDEGDMEKDEDKEKAMVGSSVILNPRNDLPSGLEVMSLTDENDTSSSVITLDLV